MQALEKCEKISLAQAIKAAGGFTRLTNRRVQITRYGESNKRVTVVVDLRGENLEKSTYLVESGDFVFVPENVG